MSYDPKSIEQHIYRICKERGYFEIEGNANIAKSDTAFCLMMPPPNVTGVLHIGHALTFTLQDIITRFKRMDGFATLYQPGLDHAGIATQNVVEKQLLAQGLSKETLGREDFIKRVWQWKEESGGKIVEQMQALGISPAWSRLRFTMDSGLQNAVREAFVAWYERGLIYQGDYMVNWCVKDGALSDIEVEYKEQETHLYHLRYSVVDSNEVLLVATTRPETFFGDSAVMINPSDSRYTHLLGKRVVLPLVGREIPIIADSAVDMEFGTGVVKVTPAHDENDYAVGKAHALESIVIFDEKGVLNDYALGFAGRDRLEARGDIVRALQEAGALESMQAYSNQVGVCYRCGNVIEPYVSKQWFIDEGIATNTIEKVNAQRDSALGNQGRVGFLTKNGDCYGESALITTQGKSLDSPCKTPFLSQKSCRENTALKSPKNYESNTVNLRIREEENQASLSSRADEVGVAIHKSARVDSSTAQNLSEPAQDSRICENAKNLTESQAEAVEMRNRGFQAIDKGATLSVVTADNRVESAIYRSNATPTLQDSMQGSCLGLSYSNDEVQATLDSLKAIYEKHSFDTIKHLTAKALSEGKVIGWHQGRCEFGPRALGARSILGDPRNTTMQKTMNLKIKYRESFRPFAPSVLDFAINEWFECDYMSPYMLLVAPVKREKCYPLTKEQKELFGIDKLNIVRSEIPSVTHIDYSARIQSVHKETNPRYYALIEEFYKLSGVPVLVNTSFNVRGEPMVCSPYDSYACFMGTEMDLLVIEDFILYKENQPKEHIARFKDIKDKYELD